MSASAARRFVSALPAESLEISSWTANDSRLFTTLFAEGSGMTESGCTDGPDSGGRESRRLGPILLRRRRGISGRVGDLSRSWAPVAVPWLLERPGGLGMTMLWSSG